MIGILVKEDEELEKAINRFKKNVVKEGVISEVKRREYFVKPSKLRHEKNKKIKRKQARKRLSDNKDY